MHAMSRLGANICQAKRAGKRVPWVIDQYWGKQVSKSRALLTKASCRQLVGFTQTTRKGVLYTTKQDHDALQ